MRRIWFISALLVLLGFAAVTMTVTAQEEFDLHPHMLLQRPEIGLIDGVPHLVGYRRCVDLAGNRAVPLHAHHDHLHFGTSGVSFGGNAGHAVVPVAPFPSPLAPSVPWSNCAEFASFIPFPLPPEE